MRLTQLKYSQNLALSYSHCQANYQVNITKNLVIRSEAKDLLFVVTTSQFAPQAP
jgi:hypothetical protein